MDLRLYVYTENYNVRSAHKKMIEFFLDSMGLEDINVEVVKHCGYQEPEKHIDLAIFPGGPDIEQALYDDEVMEYYGVSQPISFISADMNEYYRMEELCEAGVPVIGICRGAQMGCIVSGGKLITHTPHHKISKYGTHKYLIRIKDKYVVSYTISNHHQMMFPYTIDEDSYDIIGFTPQATDHRQCYIDEYCFSPFFERPEIINLIETDNIIPVDPEVVYFKETGILAIQGHPERQIDGLIDDKNRKSKMAIKLKNLADLSDTHYTILLESYFRKKIPKLFNEKKIEK